VGEGGEPELGGTAGDLGNIGGTSSGGTVTAGGTAPTGGVNSGGESAGGVAHNEFPCTDPVPVENDLGEPSSIEHCATGGSHRVEPAQCSSRLPRSETCDTPSGAGDSSAQCATDADCEAKPHGVCTLLGQVATCQCSYGCLTDADCGGKNICVCSNDVGFCQSASCRTDDDCTAGFQCRSFRDPGSTICNMGRFECQTPSDECEADAQCPTGQVCISDTSGVHRCLPTPPCLVPGRPFLVGGQILTADLADRTDWLAAGDRSPAAVITPAAARALCAHYSRAARLEHASVAAFARFALQLLHLGAPAELVLGAQQAMGDELEHATLCFALASRFAGTPLGPSVLPLDGCLDCFDLESVLRLTIREGCLGETVAAVEAREALAHARDPSVRATLAKIERDETRHAELAFRFVRWALHCDADLVRVVLEEIVAAQRPAARAVELAGDPVLLDHGLLPEAHATMLAQRALDEVALPLLSELANESSRRAA
jgi:hypothetical protein